MSLRDATIDRERRDLVSHEVLDESRLIRFVAGPDGQVVPDLGRKLPGRGLWVEASRASVEAAVKKNGFTRSAKTKLTAAALRAGKADWVIEASDGAADGRGKILALARHQTAKVCGAFTADDLSLALGLENAIHAVLLAGGRADRWTIEVERLAGFRPLRPPHWDVPGGEDGSAGATPIGAS